MATLGQTARGGTAENGWALNTMWGRIGTAPSNGTVTGLSCDIDNFAGNIKLALYSENGTANGPGTKIYGNETGEALSANGFYTDNSATGSLVSGTVYWIGVKLDSNTPSTFYDLDGAYLGLYDSNDYATAWPSSETFTTATTRRWSVYVTYSTAAPVTIAPGAGNEALTGRAPGMGFTIGMPNQAMSITGKLIELVEIRNTGQILISPI